MQVWRFSYQQSGRCRVSQAGRLPSTLSEPAEENFDCGAELGFDQSEHAAVVSSIKAKWVSRYESRRVKLYRENPGLKRIIQYASEKSASTTSSRPCLVRSMALPSRRKRISETCCAFATADLTNDCLPRVYAVQIPFTHLQERWLYPHAP